MCLDISDAQGSLSFGLRIRPHLVTQDMILNLDVIHASKRRNATR